MLETTVPTLDFNETIVYFLNRIQLGHNFTMSRYGDGELAIVEKRDIDKTTQAFTVDGWSFSDEDHEKPIVKDMFDSLQHDEENYYYGIVCPCCHGQENVERYIKALKTKNVTYANLWVNSNYQTFCHWLMEYNQKEIVLIANSIGKDKKYPFTIKDSFWVEDDWVNWYSDNRDAINHETQELATRHKNSLFLVSAGPLANILVHKLYEANPDNIYIDSGSTLDPWIKREMTRPYQDPRTYFGQLKCSF